MISLANKYRPQTFDDVVEQENIKKILLNQLETGETKNAYLFCGGAGTGKTTCARIFANEINHHEGNPIEMDAASNSGVDDVRNIIQQAKTKSLDSEYKVFIIDECHSISNTGWQAFLKLIEEPPAKTIFIFCTTDPQKIPKTILSRVQRYDFQRISHKSIVDRLKLILDCENQEHCADWEHHTERPDGWIEYTNEALDYIAKLADGGMRDALTMLDKCIAYSTDVTLDNVVKALGVADYGIFIELLCDILDKKPDNVCAGIEQIHMRGFDLKQFMRQFTNFVLDVCKYKMMGSFEFIETPRTFEGEFKDFAKFEITPVLETLVKLNADLKWETSPKQLIEAILVLECVK